MAVGAVQHHGVHAGGSQELHPLQHIRRYAHAGRHPQALRLYPGHLGGLGRSVHVLMDDADAALAGHGGGHGGFRHGVHGGGGEGDVQGNVAGESAFQGYFTGKDFRIGGHKEDVVESDPLLGNTV